MLYSYMAGLMQGKPYAMPDLPPLVKSRVSHTEPFTISEVHCIGVLYV